MAFYRELSQQQPSLCAIHLQIPGIHSRDAVMIPHFISEGKAVSICSKTLLKIHLNPLFFPSPPPKKRTWRDDKARHEHQKAIKAKLLSVGAADSSQTWARRHTHCRLTLRAVQCNAMQTFPPGYNRTGGCIPFCTAPFGAEEHLRSVLTQPVLGED